MTVTRYKQHTQHDTDQQAGIAHQVSLRLTSTGNQVTRPRSLQPNRSIDPPNRSERSPASLASLSDHGHIPPPEISQGNLHPHPSSNVFNRAAHLSSLRAPNELTICWSFLLRKHLLHSVLRQTTRSAEKNSRNSRHSASRIQKCNQLIRFSEINKFHLEVNLTAKQNHWSLRIYLNRIDKTDLIYPDLVGKVSIF